jgi:hypothetical protein
MALWDKQENGVLDNQGVMIDTKRCGRLIVADNALTVAIFHGYMAWLLE